MGKKKWSVMTEGWLQNDQSPKTDFPVFKFPKCLCGASTRQLEFLLWRAIPESLTYRKIAQFSLYSGTI